MDDLQDESLGLENELGGQMVSLLPGDCEELSEQDFFPSYHLPISVESCWVLNRAYQHSLRDFQDLLIEKLEENRALQEQILLEEEQSGLTSSGHFYPNSLLKFMAPYFRDCKGLSPGDNDDVKLRKSRGDINISYTRIKKPWRDKDRQTLVKAVQAVALKSMIEPLHREEEGYVSKLEVKYKDITII